MNDWIAHCADGLWRNAVAVIPLALVVALLCRLLPRRPAMRHALWLFVLIWLAAPPILPTADFGLGEEQTNIPAELNKSSAWDIMTLETTDDGSSCPSAEPVEDGKTLDAICDIERQVPVDDPFELAQAPTPPWTDGSAEAAPPERFASAERSAGSLSAWWVQVSPHVVSTLRPVLFWRLGAIPVPPTSGPGASGHGCDVPDSCLTTDSVEAVSPDAGQPEPFAAFRATSAQPPAVAILDVDYSLPGSDDAPIARRILDDGGIPSIASEPAEPSGAAPPRQAVEQDRQFMLTDALVPWATAMLAVRDAVGRIPPLPNGVWFTGLAVLLVARFIRVARCRRRLAKARGAPPSVLAEVRRAAERMELRRCPDVRMVEDRLSPMIWCGREPRLLLPAELWSQLDRSGRQAVLLHELAHIRRRDHWVNWFESIVGSLFWWHPVVWWIRRRLREEAENCCDAWVTWLLPRGRRAYAEALVVTQGFVSQGPSASAGVGIAVISGRAKRFSRRLTMVMTQAESPRNSLSALGLVAALAVAGWLATPARSSPPQPPVGPAAPAPAAYSVPPAAPAPPSEPTVGTGPSYAFAPPAAGPAIAPAVVGQSGGDRDLERRMERLERQLEMLADQLERLADNDDDDDAPRRYTRRQAPPSPTGHAAPPPPAAPGEEYSYVYALQGEKLERLTKLLVRDDVPIKVRPSDGGIEVIATAGQHATFAAFVRMISEGEEKRGYHLGGQLDDLIALMALDDVPVLVSPADGAIIVHGNGAVQAVFESFTKMINPPTVAFDPDHETVTHDGDEHRIIQRSKRKALKQSNKEQKQREKDLRRQARAQAAIQAAVQRLQEVQNKADARKQIADLKRAMEQIAHTEAMTFDGVRGILRQQTETLGETAHRLEAEAAALEEKADALREKAEALRRKAEETRASEDRGRLQSEADSLERTADEIEAGAGPLFARAEGLQGLAEELASAAGFAVALHNDADHEHEYYHGIGIESDDFDFEDDEDAEYDDDDDYDDEEDDDEK